MTKNELITEICEKMKKYTIEYANGHVQHVLAANDGVAYTYFLSQMPPDSALKHGERIIVCKNSVGLAIEPNYKA